MRFVLRFAGLAFCVLFVPAVLAIYIGRYAAVLGVGFSVVFGLWVYYWLPRSAHAAFDTGRFKTAARRYRALHQLATSTGRERFALISQIGCAVASDDRALAERLLAKLPAELSAAEHAVCLNNRAMLLVAGDPSGALALVDEATALRPDVPALQHTRAIALLGVGRTDDAIAILDGMRAAGELPPRLEADRCRDLAKAWAQKGQTAYAEDYRLRAEALSR